MQAKRKVKFSVFGVRIDYINHVVESVLVLSLNRFIEHSVEFLR